MSAEKNTTSDLSFFQKLISKIRYGLFLNAVRTTLIKAGIEISPYYLFREGADVKDKPEIHGLDSEYITAMLEPEDLKCLESPDSGFSKKEVLDAIAGGGKCIGLTHKDVLAAIMLINFSGISYKETAVIRLKDNEAYLWAMYTSIPYRGKNIAPYLRYKSYEILNGMGRDVLYSISDYFNSPAVKFKSKLNARKLKLILFIQLFRRWKWSLTLKTYQE